VATLRNLLVSVIHLYSRSPALTGVASGSFRLGFPVFPQAVRVHIVRGTGAPAAQHPFLSHPWCVRDSDREIAWGVLTSVRYGAGRGGFSLSDPAVTPARGQLFAVPPRPV